MKTQGEKLRAAVKKERQKEREKDAENRKIRQTDEAKQKRKELFAEVYNKLKVWNRLPINKINMKKFFFIMSGFEQMKNLSLNAIAVYPCLCSQANFEKDDWFAISQQNIAKMAGISVNSVMVGINDLIRFNYGYNDEDGVKIKIPFLEKKKETDGKRHFMIYRVGFVRKRMIVQWDTKFIFYTCIIDSGIWGKLEPRAKALYLTMRSTAKFNARLYCKVEGITYLEEDYNDEGYRNRKWDVCNKSLSELCRMVGGGLDDDNNKGKGMSSSNIHIIVKQLEHYGLIEKVNNQFMVYLKPLICRNDENDND